MTTVIIEEVKIYFNVCNYASSFSNYLWDEITVKRLVFKKFWHAHHKPLQSKNPLAKLRAESISCNKQLLSDGWCLFLLSALLTLLASLQHLLWQIGFPAASPKYVQLFLKQQKSNSYYRNSILKDEKASSYWSII